MGPPEEGAQTPQATADRQPLEDVQMVKTPPIYIDLPRQARLAGVASQRSAIVRGLMKMSRRISIHAISLVRREDGSHIVMRLLAPSDLVNKLPGQLSLAVQKGGAASFEKRRLPNELRLETAA
jgi:hypothetical protein